MNDVFSKNGEAGGQYYYPNQVKFHKEKKLQAKIKPNYSFDLCRLAMTILDEININKVSQNLLSLLNHMCTDKNNDNYRNMEDDFTLYDLNNDPAFFPNGGDAGGIWSFGGNPIIGTFRAADNFGYSVDPLILSGSKNI